MQTPVILTLHDEQASVIRMRPAVFLLAAILPGLWFSALSLPAQEIPLFQVDRETACMPATITISNVFGGGDAYLWNFGNGQASFSPQPAPVVYQEPGVYAISLSVTAAQGQRLLNRIEVDSIPGNWWELVDNVPDLYAVVKDQAGNVLFRSSTVTAHPSGGPVSLPVAGLVGDQVYTIQVWDFDLIGNNDYLGEVEIDGGMAQGTASNGPLSLAFGSVPAEEQYYYELEVEVGIPAIELDDGYLRVTYPPEGPTSTYQWYLDGAFLPGLATSAILPQGPGIYTVRVNQPGCFATSPPFEYDPLVAAEEVNGELPVRVYPNPAGSDLFIGCECPAGTLAVLYNAIGSEVSAQPLSATQGASRLSLEGLAGGLYMLRLMDADRRVMAVRQVVKQ